jgi:hypothetical protein
MASGACAAPWRALVTTVMTTVTAAVRAVRPRVADLGRQATIWLDYDFETAP